eukprot:CAMPEP_0196669816 /NCGR_PEP_ID=MMETSP1090-20130531/881_1 /TAXON_ID=37098 /ORGANISM="Isochrysis sp, Strain CCMP1244" /LENGTH=180 /DNA_ID=CAMNT_0042007391 /DNA_START=8 /DNA_END=545 /DNA_ORIENTATION=-
MSLLFALVPLALRPLPAARPAAAAALRAHRPRHLCRHLCVRAEMPNLDGTGSLRTLVDYPARMDIKAIGETVGDDGFVADMQKLAEAAAPARPVEVRWRDKGRFRSVTLRCTFRSADEVYALYASLDADERVKFKLLARRTAGQVRDSESDQPAIRGFGAQDTDRAIDFLQLLATGESRG